VSLGHGSHRKSHKKVVLEQTCVEVEVFKDKSVPRQQVVPVIVEGQDCDTH
jgi:hypothetical protein